MAYTETKTTSYGSRLGSSFRGIGTGLLLFAGATALLWWNEGRAVHTAQDIKEVGKNAQHVDDISTADASLEGQLIHANGSALTQDVLTDASFGVSVNALSLVRDVEYYQWNEHQRTETKEKIGGSKEEVTTYTYAMDWSSSPVNSASFKDPEYQGKNWVIATFDDLTSYAANVSFGAYALNDSQIHRLANRLPKQPLTLDLNPEQLAEMNQDVKQQVVKHSQSLTATMTEQLLNDTILKYVSVQGNQIYLGKDPSQPQVGDVRITFRRTILPSDISLIAVVKGNSFTSYKTKNDSNDEYLSVGTYTLAEMMQSAEEGNTTMTWVLRVIGFLLAFAALRMVFDLLVTLLKVLPFLASIMNWGVKLVCGLVAAVWSLVIIALAWIWYRPVVGISLLVVAGGLIYYFATKGKTQHEGQSSLQ